MPAHVEIKNRWNEKVICTGKTIAEAVSNNLANLRYADLRGVDLGGVNLADADLSGACLADAYLGGVNLRNAYLRGVDLRNACLAGVDLHGACLAGAYLSGSDLSGSDLSGSDLSGSDLSGAKLSWESHDLISEILRRSAGDDISKLKAAGFVLLCREKCWSEFLDIRDPLAGWALGVLREWIVDGDEHPDCLDAEPLPTD